jgi:redox-sensing transcriptional repressor
MSIGRAKLNDDTPTPQPPKAVVSRLSLYLRELQCLLRDGKQTISSTQLGALLGFTDAQVRKDLAYFGQFGYPGIGYRCSELVDAIKNILGTNRDWPMALIGLGNLGRALLRYKGFGHQGFRVVAIFDTDPSKIGKTVEGLPIYALDDLKQMVPQKGIRLAVLAVPATSAQTVADLASEAGVEGILNFAPVTLSLPPHVEQIGVDLAMELEQLAFAVAKRTAKEDDVEDRPAEEKPIEEKPAEKPKKATGE